MSKASASRSPESIELEAWAQEHSSAPSDWRVLAIRLARSQDMEDAWLELRKLGVKAGPLHALVKNAFLAANKEVSRMPSKEEAESYEQVRIAVERLKTAIETSPLPKGTGAICELRSDGEATLPVLVGWRDLPDNGYGVGYSISVVEILDLAVELLASHQQSLPPRAVTKHGKNPLVSAFIRWVSFYFADSFSPSPGYQTLARVATAALDLADPLDKDMVKSILRDAPQGFRRG